MTGVRSATAADYSAFLELNSQVHQIHAKNYPAYFKPAAHVSEAEFNRFISTPDVHILIGHENLKVWGYAFFEVWRQNETPFSHAVTSLYLRQIAVDASCRRGGHGRKLLESVIASAREQKIQKIELDCWAFNQDAISFFRRCGFALMKERLHLDIATT